MKITFELVENILKTLPIGYYLVGRTLDVSLNKISETSYCIPDQNKIVIAYNNLLDCCKDIEYSDIQALENDIRCLLYHELSHVILTPSYLINGWIIYCQIADILEKEISKMSDDKKKQKDILENIKKFIGMSFGTDFEKACKDIFNIFEDTRIETILGSYYMNVDFVSFRKRCLGFEPLRKFDSWTDEFYWTVRFFYGNKKLVEKVMVIVNNNNTITSATNDYNSNVNYARDIAELVVEIVLRYYKPDEVKSIDIPKPQITTGGAGPTVPGKNPIEEGPVVPTDNHVEEGPENPEGQENPEGPISEVPTDQPKLTPEQLESIKEMVKSILNDKFKEIDEIYSTFKTSIDRLLCSAFNKKRVRATSINGYSGRLNVRNLLNPTNLDNYKWFNKKSNDGINNTQFNKIKLNLFIDCSGSFCVSMPIINSLIRALTYLESQYKDFEFDVVKIGERVELANKNNRFCKAGGGNRMPDKLIEIYNKIQTKKAVNYNIVVFDGYALSDSRDRTKESRNFRAFNHPNTTIISDDSNKSPIETYSPKSRNILVTKKYAERLVENVINTLTSVLR